MPARPGNITNITSSEGLATLNQQIREIHIRIDQTNKQIPLHKIIKTSATLNFGSVPANGTVERSAYLTGATQSSSVHASPQLALGNTNLVWSQYVSKSGQVTIRLLNPTSSPVTANTVKWNIVCTQ